MPGRGLVLTNTGATTLNWSLSCTSAWLSASVTRGSLTVSGPATNVTVSLIPSATTNLPPGRYFENVVFTNTSSGAVSVRQFKLVISAGDAPIPLTGFNACTIAANTATTSLPGANAFDLPNNYCFYQAGLGVSTRGLPPDAVFTSQLDGTNVFQFLHYGGTNALLLGYGYASSDTLTLTTPRAYNSLDILACSVNGGGVGTFVLNYTNGVHSPTFTFNAQDWFSSTNSAAIQGIGRLKLGSGFAGEDNGANFPCLFQTRLNLAALGVNQEIASITFTKPSTSGAHQTFGIFAVSGFPSYREPVIVRQPSPTNSYRLSGSSNTWSVAVEAGFPVSYYWRLNGAAIPSANSPSLTFTNLQTTNSGDYTVLVSNSFGMTTSVVASLTVTPAPAYPVGQFVLTDCAIGYWRLAETSGPVAHDHIGTNNGAFTPTVLLGQPGYKLLDTHCSARFGSLAVSNSCVTNIPVDFSGAANAAFSVEAWVNGGSQTTDSGIFTKGYGSGGEQFKLDCGGGSHAFRFFVRDSTGSARVASSPVTPNSQWHHLVGVFDQAAGYVYLYADGTNAAQATIKTNIGVLGSSIPMSIGSRKSGSATTYDYQFAGNIEEVAAYGYALIASQVRTHYQGATNRPPFFVNNPFSLPAITAGRPIAGFLSTNATDPNGDTVTFGKLSRPAWLSVATSGSITGTPLSADSGSNTFTVRVADTSGLFSTANMIVPVAAAPPIILSAAFDGSRLLLGWTGGFRRTRCKPPNCWRFRSGRTSVPPRTSPA